MFKLSRLLFFVMTLIMPVLSSSEAQAELKHQAKYVQIGIEDIQTNQQNYWVVTITNQPGWHTYWKNPGDAGLPIDLKFFNGTEQLSLTELEWPTPKRYIEQGNLWAYGYSDTNYFFFHISKEELNKLENQNITLKAKWLVCMDICLPEQTHIEFKIKNAQIVYENQPNTGQQQLLNSLQSLPTQTALPENIEIYLNQHNTENSLVLNAVIKNFDPARVDGKRNILTPFNATPFGFKHETLYFDQANKTLYLKTLVDWDGDLQEPVMNWPTKGLFEKPLKMKFLFNTGAFPQAVVIEKEFDQFSITGQKTLDDFYLQLGEWNLENEKQTLTTTSSDKSFIYYLLLAFLGGFILNFMPCVLPVISFKLFGLIVHRDEQPADVLKHNLFYSLGVVSSFLVLAIIIIIIKSTGAQVGWGFQLQSPLFVAIMIIGLFILSLNLFGLFEFVTPFGKKLGNAQLKKGIAGDFMSGVFATILSTPCSAPFLGAALTFAFTTSNLNVYIIFSMIGLGLSLPFLITGFFPKTISFLPRPGAWMELLKQLLGISLLLTTVWLYDVLLHLVDFSLLGIYFNTLIVLIFCAFYFPRKLKQHHVWKSIFRLAPIVMLLWIIKLGLLDTPVQSNTKTNNNKQDNSFVNSTWSAWSEERLSQERESKNWVFIDFTAKWCLTCKVNKKLVLETADFLNLAQKNNMTLLVADWTKRDDNITQWLAQYSIVGVPAYFVQKPNGEIVSLGEVVTVDKIRKILDSP
jgi:thiol:disulfide interchange protein/DsbC/DsbD-like thiol-disulfide interchange protein